MAAADKQGEQKVTMRVKAADGGDEEVVHTQGLGRLCSWRRLSGAASN